MKIICRNCKTSQTTSASFLVKLIGGAMPVGGFWAWVTYLFAGTGFALPICIAIVTGGTAMLVFQNQIVQWIIDRGYKCPKCGASRWDAQKG